DAEGRTLLSINPNGDPRDGGRRTWSQAEALRAHLQVWREGTAAAGERAIASFDILMDEFLTPEGGWIDHFDADGRVLSQHMPASTGYHVVQAFCELIACFDD
ncbi:MAG: AGE family epimerase/isomerase, partial [Pseudomonadota bacterium]